MNKSKLIFAAVLAPLLALPVTALAEVTRDCVVEGTVKRNEADTDRVYVSFHSAKPAEEGAPCRMHRREKLRFKGDSTLADAEPGTRVKYRYTEDSEKGSSWKLQKTSN